VAGPGRPRRARARPWRRPACRSGRRVLAGARPQARAGPGGASAPGDCPTACLLGTAHMARWRRRQARARPWGGTCLQDGDAHDAHAVVRQQLQADDGRAHERGRQAADVGRHGRQAQLQPQAALQVQVAHQHRQLRPRARARLSPSIFFLTMSGRALPGLLISAGCAVGGADRAAPRGARRARPPRSQPRLQAAPSPPSFSASTARGVSALPRPCTKPLSGARPLQPASPLPPRKSPGRDISSYRHLPTRTRQAAPAPAGEQGGGRPGRGRGTRLEAPAPLPDLDKQQHARAARVAHVHHAVQVRVLARGALTMTRRLTRVG